MRSARVLNCDDTAFFLAPYQSITPKYIFLYFVIFDDMVVDCGDGDDIGGCGGDGGGDDVGGGYGYG